MKVNNAINYLIFNTIVTIVNIFLIIHDFLLDENLENKNTLNPIQEENYLTEDQEKSESNAKNNNTNKDLCQKDDDEDIQYKFPDTQIKIDLSGSK